MKKLLLTASVVFFMFSCQKDNESTVNAAQPNATPSAIASIENRGCASEQMLALDLQKDPALAARMANIETQTKNVLSTSRIVNGVIEIPMVFNVLYNTAADNTSLAQIQSQVDTLNKDFNATNSDYNTANNPYSSVRANIGIRFVLDRVIRKQSPKTIWYSEDGYMKIAAQGGMAPTSPTTKLNVWVVNNLASRTSGQLLGYAQFPGGSSATDGYVCGNYCLGTIGTAAAPYNLGRTATHEIGHWMNLRHIWGDGNGCASDLVSDTPLHDSPNFGVPAVGHRSTCTGTPLEMYMNYMDYTDDRGMYMFSLGQKSRMNALFAVGGARASFRL
ncbi:putative M43 cytophagalysin family metalloprotease [Flavobacterium psychrophilum]|uniref:zinc metalloprotease n=1 Tax=Flavobacterium psychrophilum TaxID=96345 RepID=UPI000B7C4D57|nr:zinc metalloprotease [Flavobacterium psychrophilum]SNB02694.1 putative M43 cytophagalysin family metalloprotease [Flavobacterium psychrophilum]